ncbi:hypothetical protein BDQ12DRAFT_727098 [Crucibulum laeve]|uniref:Uncharacterized protein n=1 Tax=Crucibulum laeve TaxID=68775 RepID=A0A5C3LNI7_9AGAR|nr:hypothetical protein BDQ12DRAFT_727098 [Crucibulum laeve]
MASNTFLCKRPAIDSNGLEGYIDIGGRLCVFMLLSPFHLAHPTQAAPIAIVLATYPYPTVPATDPLYSPSTPSNLMNASPPVVERSRDWQAIHNLMIAFSGAQSFIEPYRHHFSLARSHFLHRDFLSTGCTSVITIHLAHPHPPPDHIRPSPLSNLSSLHPHADRMLLWRAGAAGIDASSPIYSHTAAGSCDRAGNT